MRTFERQLPVRLTTDEMVERGWSLSETRKRQQSIEGDKKAAADGFKFALEAVGTEIDRLAEIVHSKSEYRPVLCHEKRDYTRGVVEVIRRDTSEIVESRVMSEQERQRELREIDEAQEASEVDACENCDEHIPVGEVTITADEVRLCRECSKNIAEGDTLEIVSADRPEEPGRYYEPAAGENKRGKRARA